MFNYNSSRSNPQCTTNCAFPFTKITNTTYGGYFDCESTCQIATGTAGLFVSRLNQTCINSCPYSNTSTINSVSYQICETVNDTTYCPYYSRITLATFTCVSTCSGKYNLNNLCVTTCINETLKYVNTAATACVS